MFSKFQVFRFFLDEGLFLFYYFLFFIYFLFLFFPQNFCNYCPWEPVRDEVYKQTAIPNFLVASDTTCTIIKFVGLQLYTRLQLCFFLLEVSSSSFLTFNKAL